MTNIPNDIDRLIQEVLSELGFDADAAKVAQRVRQLNYGLPAEDEFSVICAWLGRTQLLHKLDQHQTPISSRQEYQVPDIFVKFELGGPLLVEVKVCNDQTLSFKPEYHARLERYSCLASMPLLVAWKFHSVWTLFDFRHLRLARTNFNIAHNEAVRQNLLGVLAGDAAFALTEGAGVHIDMSKEELVDTKSTDAGKQETWRARITSVRYSISGGEFRTNLHPETAQLLTAWELQLTEVHASEKITQSFTVGSGNMEFAHRALVRLLDWEAHSDKRPNWRALLQSTNITRSITHFASALNRGLTEGVITHIFHQQPVTMPDFLCPPKTTE